MTDTKKKWVKPELTVLLRGRPEEVVLRVCKYLVGEHPTGDEHRWRGCETNLGGCNSDCEVKAAS